MAVSLVIVTRLSRFALRQAHAILVLAYVVHLTLFVCLVLAHQRGYQDSWLLEDIFWPTALLIFLGVLAAFAVRRASAAAVLLSSLAFALNVVPALKYDLFYGVGDVPSHFWLVRSVVEGGEVPTGLTYSQMPGGHLLVASVSLVTGLTTNDSFKLAPPIYLSSLPLIAYLVGRRCSQREDLRKSIVIAAMLPSFGFFTMIFSGSLSGLFLLFLLLSLLIARESQSDRQTRGAFSLASILVVFALIVHHAVTMIFALSVLLCANLLLLIYQGSPFWEKMRGDSRLAASLYWFTALAAILAIAWWMYQADLVFRLFVTEIRDVVNLVEPRKPPIPSSFGQIPVLDRVRVLIVAGMAAYVVPVLLSALGIGVMITRRRSGVFQGFGLAGLFGLAVLVPASVIGTFELVRGYGSVEIERFAGYVILASPVFAGVAIWYLRQHGARSEGGTSLRKFAATGGLVVVFGVYLLNGFPWQPLVPSASTLSETLPAEEPLVVFHAVNTSYQARMITFVDQHRGDSQFVAADSATRDQVSAFGSSDLGRHVLYPSYLQEREWLEASPQMWDLLLLHWPGKSGTLEEKAEFRTKQRIHEIRAMPTHSTIYDNGESFVIWRPRPDDLSVSGLGRSPATTFTPSILLHRSVRADSRQGHGR